MITALVISALVGFASGAACMRPARRKARHGRMASAGAWQQIGAALLLIDAKGVYARKDRGEQPGKQETNPHHATPA